MRICFQSFEGRYSDSPRVLHERLQARGGAHEHVWLCDPAYGAAFPPDVETVEYGSADCVEALERADLVIANTHTDVEWHKAAGCTYVQTWHGTPLKTVHRDVRWAPAGRLDRLSRDVDRWDLLLSQGPAATPLLRRAFRFDGPVHETGYPRDDPLSAPDAAERRATLRANLGLAAGTVAVLYAPTWRDDEVFPEGGASFRLGLDLEAFTAALGETHVLLARLHPLVSDRLDGVGHPAIRDVSDHPEITDLFLAADVLVTDYSSAMFDFAITGRPIVLFAYDLDAYARLRGFYLDPREIAPGPVVTTTAELLTELGDLDGVRRRFATRHAAFRARFCPYDDGGAAERVLALLPDLVA